jgi:hypothetical protein
MPLNALMAGYNTGNNYFQQNRNNEFQEREYEDRQGERQYRNALVEREYQERKGVRDKQATEQEKAWLSNGARTLHGLAKNPTMFSQAAQFYANDPIAKKYGITAESITPESVATLVAQMDMQAGAAPQAKQYQAVGAGQSILERNPDGSLNPNPVYSPPSGSEAPVNRQLTTRPVGNGKVQDYGYNPRSNKLEPVGDPYDADPGGVNSRKGAMPLRKEFRSLESVKNYETVLPLIKSAEKAPDTGYGDLQLIYTVGKTLDPGSVVREGELALTIAAGSPLQRILGFSRFNTENGGRLTPQQRGQIIDMLNQRVNAAKTAYDRDYKQYADYARESGVDPSMVVGGNFDESYQSPEPTQTATGPNGEKLGLVNGQWVPLNGR